MFGFHQRERSLIPVQWMDKGEKKDGKEKVEEEEECETYTTRQRRNLTMIYLLFLAEAIMASSLSSQIDVLLPSNTGCASADTAFLRSILQCAYYFGSAAGMFWGCVADKQGRRMTALTGLFGMSICCVTMGFMTSFPAFGILRFIAGVTSSATAVSGMAMIADFTHGSSNRTKIVARLPVIAVCGSIGPLAAHIWSRAIDGQVYEVFARYPGLSGQIACATLVSAIGAAEVFLLEETLPARQVKQSSDLDDVDCEKVAFLGQTLPNDADDNLSISIIDALNDEAAVPLPSRIGIMQMLTAPTVLILLASFSVLSLHSSAFEILLPHIGHISARDGGMGIPCAWLQPVITVVKVLAAIRVLRVVPFIVSKVGLLQMYRRISAVFPVLYVVVPLLAILISSTDAPSMISAMVSTISMLAKTTLAEAAHVLVLLIGLSAAPDASSTGTVIGLISISELFKALAIGVSGLSYYLSDSYSVVFITGSLWTLLVLLALGSAVVAWKLRETPIIGADIPEDCFVWQGVFDADSEDEAKA